MRPSARGTKPLACPTPPRWSPGSAVLISLPCTAQLRTNAPPAASRETPSRLDWVGCDHELRLGEAVHGGKDFSLLAVPDLQRLTCQCQQRSARLIHLERIHLAGEDLVFHVLLVRLGINQGDLLVALRVEEFPPPATTTHAGLRLPRRRAPAPCHPPGR